MAHFYRCFKKAVAGRTSALLGSFPVKKTVLLLSPMTMFELVGATDPSSQAKLWVWNLRRSVGKYDLGGYNGTYSGSRCSQRIQCRTIFLKRNEPWRKAISISHEKSGFEQLGRLLTELQTQTADSPVERISSLIP